MGIIPDSHNEGTFERKTSKERSVRNRTPLTDSGNYENVGQSIRFTIGGPRATRTRATGVTRYPK